MRKILRLNKILASSAAAASPIYRALAALQQVRRSGLEVTETPDHEFVITQAQGDV
jgi:hypothetical protein